MKSQASVSTDLLLDYVLEEKEIIYMPEQNYQRKVFERHHNVSKIFFQELKWNARQWWS